MITRIIAVMMLAGSAVALDLPTNIVTKSGMEYTRCEFRRHEPDGITFKHSKGIVKVSFEDIDKEIASAFGYDPAKASAYQAESAARRNQHAANAARKAQHAEVNAAIASTGIDVNGRVVQVIPGSGLMLMNVYQLKTVKERAQQTTPIIRMTPVKVDKTVREYLTSGDRRIFVYADTAGYVDGSGFSGIIYPAGEFSYTAGFGQIATVSAYATSPEMVKSKYLADSAK
jgi:hypothetical protein